MSSRMVRVLVRCAPALTVLLCGCMCSGLLPGGGGGLGIGLYRPSPWPTDHGYWAVCHYVPCKWRGDKRPETPEGKGAARAEAIEHEREAHGGRRCVTVETKPN